MLYFEHGFKFFRATTNDSAVNRRLAVYFVRIEFKPVDCSTDDDQEGVMDNLLEALKSGSAFNVNRERKEGKKRTPRAAGGKPLLFAT